MRISKCFTSSRLLLLVVFCLASASAQASKFVGNGGDAFETANGQVKIFDEIEYSEAFHPVDEPAYQNIILPQIQKLAKRLPATAAYLKFIFEQGAMWFLVDAKLKNIDATGTTNLIVTSNKIQAAVTKNGITQISRDVKNRLSEQSFAFLMLHEALWSADADPKIMSLLGVVAALDRSNVDEYILVQPVKNLQISTTSEKIRTLTGIMMNPMVDRYDAMSLARLIEAHTGMAYEISNPGRDFELRKVGYASWTIPFSLPVESKRPLSKWLLDREGVMVTGLRSHRTPLALMSYLDATMADLKRKP